MSCYKLLVYSSLPRLILNKRALLFLTDQEIKFHIKHLSTNHLSKYLTLKSSPETFILVDQRRDYAKRQMNRPTKKGQSSPQAHLSEDDLNSVIDFDKMKLQMESTISHLKEELESQLQLKITLAALQSLKVETSDGKQILGEIALLQQKSPQIIIADLTDSPQFVNDVKNAIINSGFNITPQIEGVTLYLPIQKVTKEHRENLSKNAKTMCDKAIEKLRNIQSTYDRKLKSSEKDFSEDLIHDLRQAIYAETRNQSLNVDNILKNKQKELLNN